MELPISESEKRDTIEKRSPRFITKFNREIKNIIHKNWNIIQCDTILGPVINQTPKVIFRRAKSV